MEKEINRLVNYLMSDFTKNGELKVAVMITSSFDNDNNESLNEEKSYSEEEQKSFFYNGFKTVLKSFETLYEKNLDDFVNNYKLDNEKNKVEIITSTDYYGSFEEYANHCLDSKSIFKQLMNEENYNKFEKLFDEKLEKNKELNFYYQNDKEIFKLKSSEMNFKNETEQRFIELERNKRQIIHEFNQAKQIYEKKLRLLEQEFKNFDKKEGQRLESLKNEINEKVENFKSKDKNKKAKLK